MDTIRNPRLKHRILVIDGQRFRVWELPPRPAFRACARLAKLLGKSLAEIVTGAGLEIRDDDGNPIRDDDGEPIRLPLEAIKTSEAARKALARKVVEALTSADADEALRLADDLLVGHLDYDPLQLGTDAAFVTIRDVEQLDEGVPGIVGLLQLLKASLELTGVPISADRPTAAGSSAESTERAAV